MDEKWVWTEARVEKLVELWREGYSCSQIANMLGTSSRSAVIGKLHRIGQSGRGNVSQRRGATRTDMRRKKPKKKPVHMSFGNSVMVPVMAEPLPIPPASDVARVSFEALDVKHCRWPVGDVGQPGYGYCGNEKLIGASYCRGHLVRAYQPMGTHKTARQRAAEEAAKIRENQKEKVEA